MSDKTGNYYFLYGRSRKKAARVRTETCIYTTAYPAVRRRHLQALRGGDSRGFPAQCDSADG